MYNTLPVKVDPGAKTSGLEVILSMNLWLLTAAATLHMLCTEVFELLLLLGESNPYPGHKDVFHGDKVGNFGEKW